MRGSSRRVVRASGSMTRATAKVPPTGITRLGKSTVEGVQVMRPNREKLSVAAQSRADKTFLREVAIVGAAEGRQLLPSEGAVEARQPLLSGTAEGNQAPPSGEVVKALLEEASGAVT